MARDGQRESVEQHVIEADAVALPDAVSAPLQQLASDVGNRSFSASVARSGEGILPTGEARPEVQLAIQDSRGGGASLDDGVQARLAPSLGDLSDVRVHTDDTADRLNRSVAARAFTTGTDVYFASGEYQPGSSAGDELIVHELAHVVQQRGAAVGGPLVVSMPGDPMEREAEAVADELK